MVRLNSTNHFNEAVIEYKTLSNNTKNPIKLFEDSIMLIPFRASPSKISPYDVNVHQIMIINLIREHLCVLRV